jgi:hypothetical protein
MGEKQVAVRTFSLLLATLTLYYLLWQFLCVRVQLPVYYYGRLIELLGIALFAALAISTPMKFEQMGILVPKRVLFSSLSAGAGIALGFCSVLVLVAAVTGQRPLFSLALHGDISRVTYVLVAPLQEVLAKSVMLYSFELVLDRRHPHVANLLAALTFAAFHVAYGIEMMLAAGTLSLVTGWIFLKERAVWGCAVAHFCCGFFPLCFDMV